MTAPLYVIGKRVEQRAGMIRTRRNRKLTLRAPARFRPLVGHSVRCVGADLAVEFLRVDAENTAAVRTQSEQGLERIKPPIDGFRCP